MLSMIVEENKRKVFLDTFGTQVNNEVIFYFRRERSEEYTVIKNFVLSQKDNEVQTQIQYFCKIIGQCMSSFHSLLDSYNEYGEFTITNYDGMLENQILSKANRLCNTFLDSGKGFVDYIQKDWGPKNLSENNLRLWNEERKKYFDNCLSYRVCYYLRNFVEHPGNRTIFSNTVINSNKEPFLDLRIDSDNIFSDRGYAKSFINKTGRGEDYWKKDENLFINQYLPKYMIALINLYRSAMSHYFFENKQKIQKIIDYCKVGPLSSEYWFTTINHDDFMKSGKLPVHTNIKQGTNICMLDNLLIELKEEHIIKVKQG